MNQWGGLAATDLEKEKKNNYDQMLYLEEVEL